MTREEAIMWLEGISTRKFGWDEYAMQESQREIRERCEECVRDALRMAIEALKADVVSREEAIQAVDKCRERKNKEIEQLREFYSQKPTIPTFSESAEAYKAWTGEEMGKTSDEINEMNMKIIKDILKMMPTAYLLEALGVSIFEELTEPADRPHGEWIPCSDRLPSESDYYLVTNINAFEEKEVCVIWFAHKIDYGVSEWRETTDEDTILAWMPLPKPYKGGDTK